MISEIRLTNTGYAFMNSVNSLPAFFSDIESRKSSDYAEDERRKARF